MADEPTHQDILNKVDTNRINIEELRHDLAEIQRSLKQMRIDDEPIREFFQDMQTVGRIGRTVRAIIGWLVITAGALAVIWAVVIDSFGKQ